jgi:hypothetical protein
MVHTTRANYKAKWLAAAGKGDGVQSEEIKPLIEATDNIVGAEVQAAVGLRKLSNTLIEAISEAKGLVNLMDEGADIGALHFAETKKSIDLKLSEHDLNIMARRLRDILKLAGARIGILTEAYEDSYNAVVKIKEAHRSVSSQSELLQSTVANTLLIGNNATGEEFTEYLRTTRAGQDYKRHKLDYEDLDSDWEDDIFKTEKERAIASIPSPPRSDSESRIVPVSPRERKVIKPTARIDFD